MFDIRASAVAIATINPSIKETIATGTVNAMPAFNMGENESVNMCINLIVLSSNFILSPYYLDTSVPNHFSEIFK